MKKTLNESTAGYFATPGQVLADPSVHRLIHEVWALCEDRDPVDCYHDLKLVAAMIEDKLHRLGI